MGGGDAASCSMDGVGAWRGGARRDAAARPKTPRSMRAHQARLRQPHLRRCLTMLLRHVSAAGRKRVVVAQRDGAVDGGGGSASPRLVAHTGRAHAPRGPPGHRRDLQIGSKPWCARRLEDLIPSAGFVRGVPGSRNQARPVAHWCTCRRAGGPVEPRSCDLVTADAPRNEPSRPMSAARADGAGCDRAWRPAPQPLGAPAAARGA